MRATTNLVFACALLTAPGLTYGKEIWECRTAHERAQPILHLVEWGSRSYVKFAHLRFSAEHLRAEASRGWYFNNDGSGYYRYALILDDRGTAHFHHFDTADGAERSTPIDSFFCSRLG